MCRGRMLNKVDGILLVDWMRLNKVEGKKEGG